MFISLATEGMAVLGAALLALQLVSWGAGYFFGLRRAARRRTEAESVGVIVGGMMGLLAFVLALTLSFTHQRYEERRDGALKEANAIGTAWLRAHSVRHPRGTAIAALLEDYTRVRIAYIQAPPGADRTQPLNLRTGALQGEIWGHMTGIAEERRDAMAESLQRALNEVFDFGTAERYSFTFNMPPEFFWLLLSLTMVAMGAVGYQLGLRGTMLPGLSLALMLMWTAVAVMIIDLGAARLGTFTTPTAAFEWTLQGFQGGIQVPPLR